MYKKMLRFTFLMFLSGAAAVGTTPNLEESFIGKCSEYQRVINPSPFANSNEKECEDLWQTFHDAFAFKPPCNTTAEDYRAFAEAALHYMETDRHLFWEELYPFVNDYSAQGQRYVTVSDTLLGYMANGLYWCGQEEDPGINYDECPTFVECESNQPAEYSFWIMVSGYYANAASGLVSVMMNGSTAVPFTTDSIFATYELIHLIPEKNVTSMHILVVHDIGGPVIESCGEGSLADLEQQARDQGLTVTCENNPESVRHFQCADAHEAVECQSMSQYLSTGHNMIASYWVVALLVTLLSTG